jgi:hypothetical protein
LDWIGLDSIGFDWIRFDMATKISKSISSWLPKLAGLRNLLEQERSVFAAAPILLIQSQPTAVRTATATASATTTANKSSTVKKETSVKVSNACRHVQFLLQQQMGLRVVMVEHPCAYTYPTPADVDRAMDLYQRVGAETVVGVGSSAAMDLAKAVSQSMQSSSQSQSSSSQMQNQSTETTAATRRGRGNNEDSVRRNLILVPATYGGVLAAAGSCHSLLLDTKEEALTVYPPYEQQSQQQQSPDNDATAGAGGVTTTSVALEETMLDDSRRTHALLASIAIALPLLGRRNSGSRGRPAEQSVQKTALEVIQNAVACLTIIHNENSSAENDSAHEYTKEQHHDLCLRTVAQAGAGRLMSYGLQQQERSLPLALAASLIPNHFSEHHRVTFMASLLPALLDMYCDDRKDSTNDSTNIDSTNTPSTLWLDPEWIPQIRRHYQHPTAPRMVTTEPVEVLLASIRENQALWNCLDVRDAVLVRALEQHCLLPS